MADPVLRLSLGESLAKRGERTVGVFVNDKTILVSESLKKTGVTKDGKKWTSFREERKTMFSQKKGPMRVYDRHRVAVDGRRQVRTKMGPIRDVTAGTLDRLVRLDALTVVRNPIFYDGVDALFASEFSPVEKIKQDYPLSEVVMFASGGVTPLLTSQNPVELTRRILGKNYQKTVARKLGEIMAAGDRGKASNAIKLTMLLSGIVPTDWIPRVLEGTSRSLIHNEPFGRRDDLRHFRAMLKTATETQLRRITTNGLDQFVWALKEVSNDLEGLATQLNVNVPLSEYEFTSLIGLHNHFIAERNRRYQVERERYTRPLPSYDIEYKDKALDFVKEYDGFTVVAPENSGMLRDWSNYMNNCISGYARQASDGQTLLYGVNDGDRLIANIELDPSTGTVKQLLGKYNQSVPADMSAKIKSAIKENWPDAAVDGGWQ